MGIKHRIGNWNGREWETTSVGMGITCTPMGIYSQKFYAAMSLSQYSTVVLTVVTVMIAKYRKSGISGYRSSLTPEPIELKYCMSDYVAHRTPHAPRGN